MTNRPLIRCLRPSCVRLAQSFFLLMLCPVTPHLRAQAAPQSQTQQSATTLEENSSQPIRYSHRLHAGELQIQCTFCHSGARRSSAAGMPAVGSCTGCHRWVKNKTSEMIKLDEFSTSKQPILWRRINQLAEHVYFSHQRHVLAGLSCQGCHGPVEGMETIQRISSLTMGWCVTCHEQRQAPLECSTCHD